MASTEVEGRDGVGVRGWRKLLFSEVGRVFGDEQDAVGCDGIIITINVD